jgi:hypothetical protein
MDDDGVIPPAKVSRAIGFLLLGASVAWLIGFFHLTADFSATRRLLKQVAGAPRFTASVTSIAAAPVSRIGQDGYSRYTEFVPVIHFTFEDSTAQERTASTQDPGVPALISYRTRDSALAAAERWQSVGTWPVAYLDGRTAILDPDGDLYDRTKGLASVFFVLGGSAFLLLGGGAFLIGSRDLRRHELRRQQFEEDRIRRRSTLR